MVWFHTYATFQSKQWTKPTFNDQSMETNEVFGSWIMKWKTPVVFIYVCVGMREKLIAGPVTVLYSQSKHLLACHSSMPLIFLGNLHFAPVYFYQNLTLYSLFSIVSINHLYFRSSIMLVSCLSEGPSGH